MIAVQTRAPVKLVREYSINLIDLSSDIFKEHSIGQIAAAWMPIGLPPYRCSSCI